MVKSMHRERERKARLAVASEKGSQPNKGSRKALDPEQLGKLENFLRRADLSNLMRRQAVCAITPGSHAPQPVFRELYISIADLQQTVLPELDLASNLWMFQHLTQPLDSRKIGRAHV